MRALLLIDMDAFFASVEQARRPELPEHALTQARGSEPIGGEEPLQAAAYGRLAQHTLGRKRVAELQTRWAIAPGVRIRQEGC